MTDADHYRELMRPVFAGRKLIVAVDVLQGAAGAVPTLQGVRAQRPFLLAGNVGTGPLPSSEEAEQFVLGLTPEPTVMGGIRTFEDALGRLPPDAIAALDAYDPDREALVLGSFFSRQGTVAGRRVYGGRHESWEALEDKTTIDVVFDAAGIDRSRVKWCPWATLGVCPSGSTPATAPHGPGTHAADGGAARRTSGGCARQMTPPRPSRSSRRNVIASG